jgi:hypothetical protein
MDRNDCDSVGALTQRHFTLISVSQAKEDCVIHELLINTEILCVRLALSSNLYETFSSLSSVHQLVHRSNQTSALSDPLLELHPYLRAAFTSPHGDSKRI